MKRVGRGFLLLVSALVLSACASSSTKSTEMKQITVGISSEGKGNLLDATSYDSAMSLYSAVYEPLVEYGKKGEFLPGLAESWEIDPDGKKYTFHLKANQKFSDHSPVNAEAVKFTIERAKFKNESTTLQTLSNLQKMVVVDELTVELYLTELSNQVLAELSQVRPLRIMSPTSVKGKRVEGEFIQAIGSGPFVIKKSTWEQTIMKPNPYYNKSQPVDYQVNFQTITDGSARTLALRSGEVDIIGGTLGEVSEKDFEVLGKNKELKTAEFPGTMTHFLAFNPAKATLSYPIRRAIDLAIDSSKLSKKDLKGLFRETVQYVNSSNQAKNEFDLREAKKLIESEGYQLNDKGIYQNAEGELSLNLVLQTEEFPEWKQKAEVIEQYLKKANIRLTIQVLDRQSYYDVLWNKKTFDLIFYRTYTDALLPYNFLSSLYQNTQSSPGVLANDEELSKQLGIYGKTMDKNQQQVVMDQLFHRLSDQALALPIDYIDEKFVTSKRITQFTYSGLSDGPLDFKAIVVK